MPRNEQGKRPRGARCGTCIFRMDETDECRRFPPQAVALGTQQQGQRIEYRWPRMEDNDFCGEYIARPQTQNDE